MSLFFNHTADKNCTNYQTYELKTETMSLKYLKIFKNIH